MINEMHLAHAAKGLLDVAMGPEFEVYRSSRAPYIPNGDFQFVDRVMALKGTRGEFEPGGGDGHRVRLPGRRLVLRAELVPAHAERVYMESSLQAAIFLGYYLGATLTRPEEQYASATWTAGPPWSRTSICAARPSATTPSC